MSCGTALTSIAGGPQVGFIQEKFDAREGAAEEDLYLIIHNIDGPMLRGEQAQVGGGA